MEEKLSSETLQFLYALREQRQVKANYNKQHATITLQGFFFFVFLTGCYSVSLIPWQPWCDTAGSLLLAYSGSPWLDHFPCPNVLPWTETCFTDVLDTRIHASVLPFRPPFVWQTLVIFLHSFATVCYYQIFFPLLIFTDYHYFSDTIISHCDFQIGLHQGAVEGFIKLKYR